MLLIEDMVLARKILRNDGEMKGARFHAALGNFMTAKGNKAFLTVTFLCFRYERTPTSYIF